MAIKQGSKIAAETLGRSVPFIFSMLLLLSGGMLLVSAALPAAPNHVQWLHDVVPLAFVEVSHLVAAVLGLFLLVLARAVKLRLDAAYYSCISVLILAIVTALFKGFDWDEALVLTFMLLVFVPCHKYFNRKASLFTMSFPPEWIAIIGIIVGGSIWIGLEAYKHVPYAQDLWWRFSYRGDAARFLRAAVVIVLVIFAYMLNNFFKVARPQIAEPLSDDDLEHAANVARASHDPVGFLALLGDKSILWSDNGQAFIMYAMTPRYWIAMGDPVGDQDEYADLVWKFREAAYMHAAHAVFYQVSDKFLPLYLDRGLILLKMGEEARIFLPDFSLAGGRMENQRKTRNRFVKNGYIMRVLDPPEVVEKMPVLREISDRWIAMKGAKEKGFSLGFFTEDYVRHTRVAVIEKDGQILAFANLWQLDNHEDICIDLMRYTPDAPTNSMEFLFVSSILWAQENGYQWFGLGMAPLSGMEEHALAPLWHKVGRVIYKHGEDFYNFEGLHAYKSKFDPVWRPRYLAAPPGPRIPMVMVSIAGIISGGLKNIFRK